MSTFVFLGDAALCCGFMAGKKTSHGAWIEWKRGAGNTCRGGKMFFLLAFQRRFKNFRSKITFLN